MARYCISCDAELLPSWGGICQTWTRSGFCSGQYFVEKNPPTNARPLAEVNGHVNVLPFPDSPLSNALGGVAEGHTILVVGPGGVGKSTAVAHLVWRYARDKQGRVFWCNADQHETLVKATFERTKTPLTSVYILSSNDDPLAVFHDARKNDVVVIDSLQPWIKSQNPSIFLQNVRKRYITTFIIARVNAAGTAAGPTETQHEVDAVVLVTPEAFEVPDKCRWSRIPRRVIRE